MKKQLSIITLGLTILNSSLGFSQQIQPCVTVDATNQYFAENPNAKIEYEKKQAQFEVEHQAAILRKSQAKIAAVQYTIPVVFHILHTGGAENVSDAVINTALAQLNNDFAATGADFNTIYPDFKALYINSDVRFVLAKKDPNGNCTNGIVHKYDTRTLWDRNPPGAFGYLYNGITWDPTKYLNIIIVKDIVAAPSQNGTIVGYTFLPGTWGNGAVQDAVVYNYNFLTGSSARLISHEVGHWVNLIHTFGGTNNPGVSCGSSFITNAASGSVFGDGVSDTPDTKGNLSTCPATNTNSNVICSSGNPSYYQNVENIMDYSACAKNFTSGQTTRLRTSLESTISNRQNLWSAGNLTATGVNGTVSCAPIADFLSLTNFTVCSGKPLTMKDYSYNGTISTYSWSADNGALITTPTNSTTIINFPNTGTVNVTLVVGNGQGSNSITKQVIVLNGTPVYTGPVNFESFEGGSVPATYLITNNSGVMWAHTPLAGSHGNSSVFLDGTQSGAGQVDILQMPMMDVVNNPNNIFSFKYAYARQTSTQNDVFKLQGSLDCGGTWADIQTFNPASMASGSGGTTTNPYIPSAANQWKYYDVTNTAGNWGNYINSSSVLVRFYFQEDPAAGNGNRMFLDAISFVDTLSAVGINELTKSIKFNMYPNPTKSETIIKFSLNDAATISINVIDILGKVILPVTNTNYAAGEQTISINKNNSLANGIYFVNMSINGAKISRKLVIQ